MIFTIGSSLVMPSITLLLLDLFPTMRGMASSLQGFVQFSLSARRRRNRRAAARALADDAGRGDGRIHAGELCAVAHLPAARARQLEGWQP